MKILTNLFTIMFLVVGIAAYGSDPIGVYAKIDRVVFEPSAVDATKVKLYGTFAIARIGGSSFHPEYDRPKSGFMYYKTVNGKEELCRNDWNSLQEVAGKNVCVGFGARRIAGVGSANFNGTVRTTDGDGADAYPLAGELYKPDGDHDICKHL